MTYSLDFRKQVLGSLKEGKTFEEAVKKYGISPTTIQKWKKRIHSKKTRNVKPSVIDNEALLKDVALYPDGYHYERAARLKCSTSGICVALQRLGITQKKKTLKHPKACLVKRAAYQEKLTDFEEQEIPIVYIDESGFENEVLRPHGYSQIGEPCLDSYNWQARKRTSVIGALHGSTLFAVDFFNVNINSEVFRSWCKDTLIPSLKTKCVVVMDNASFHMSED